MDLQLVKKYIEEDDKDEIKKIMEELSGKEYDDVINFLLKTLEGTSNGNIRNTTAYLLGEFKCQEAVPILMDLIFKKELENNRGTLIYALGELECKEYIKRLIPLLYGGNYEVVMNVHSLLLNNVSLLLEEEKDEHVKLIDDTIERLEMSLDALYGIKSRYIDKRKGYFR